MSEADFLQRCEPLVEQIKQAPQQVRLLKKTSNLFRDRKKSESLTLLDVSDFTHLHQLEQDRAVVEGMMSYQRLVDHTLAHQAMPCVVPELKTITVGGAVAGIGIESSSFRYGLPHQSVLSMDVLTGSGELLHCRADNEHQELFRWMPNSYGTLGYALKVALKLIPTQPYVRLNHRLCHNIESACSLLQTLSDDEEVAFLDAVCFAKNRIYVCAGYFCDHAPYTSNYRWLNIFYRSIEQRKEDYLSTLDYLWRWDTDWFWCSKNLGAQWWPIRLLATPKLLNSATYTRAMRMNSRLGLTRALNRARGYHSESVIHDVDLPLQGVPEFFEFYHREVGILPLWLCPVKNGNTVYPLFPMRRNQLYVNFGFWDQYRSKQAFDCIGRKIELKLQQLNGLKSLYSESYYEQDEFDRLFGAGAYPQIKARYDPDGKFPDLFQKCVRAL